MIALVFNKHNITHLETGKRHRSNATTDNVYGFFDDINKAMECLRKELENVENASVVRRDNEQIIVNVSGILPIYHGQGFWQSVRNGHFSDNDLIRGMAKKRIVFDVIQLPMNQIIKDDLTIRLEQCFNDWSLNHKMIYSCIA